MNPYEQSPPAPAQQNFDFSQEIFSNHCRGSHYDTLGVREDASRVTIREAYLRLKHTYSDASGALYSLMGQDESRAMLAMIDEAFQVLADDTSRAQYDASIGISRSTDLPRPPLPETSTPRFLADAEAMAEQQASAMAAPPPMSAATDSSPRRALTPLRTNARSTRDPQTQAEYAKLRAAFQPDDGQLYRRLREAAGLSEGDVQRWTKMSLEHIRSIENNTLHRLPPLVYVKGYLRSLFKYLDVPDAEPLVNAFAAKIVACQQNTKG